jgi:hypothetical protein
MNYGAAVKAIIHHKTASPIVGETISQHAAA